MWSVLNKNKPTIKTSGAKVARLMPGGISPVDKYTVGV